MKRYKISVLYPDASPFEDQVFWFDVKKEADEMFISLMYNRNEDAKHPGATLILKEV